MLLTEHPMHTVKTIVVVVVVVVVVVIIIIIIIIIPQTDVHVINICDERI
jgi:hypothetical protein